MIDKCKLCGGNAGRLNGEGEHNFCRARKNSGMDTPSLGDKCEECRGQGRVPKSKNGPMMFFDSPYNITKAIEAWAPKCEKCGGTGTKKE